MDGLSPGNPLRVLCRDEFGLKRCETQRSLRRNIRFTARASVSPAPHSVSTQALILERFPSLSPTLQMESQLDEGVDKLAGAIDTALCDALAKQAA